MNEDEDKNGNCISDMHMNGVVKRLLTRLTLQTRYGILMITLPIFCPLLT